MIIYNSKIARWLRPITNKDSIPIGPIIFSSLNKFEIPYKSLNHMKTHMRQWSEIFSVSILLLIILDEVSISGIFTSMILFYIIYLIELICRVVLYYVIEQPVNNVSFEQEAEESENDESLIPRLFGWIKYINN